VFWTLLTYFAADMNTESVEVVLFAMIVNLVLTMTSWSLINSFTLLFDNFSISYGMWNMYIFGSMLLMGSFVPIDQISDLLSWAHWLTPFQYAYSAAIANQFPDPASPARQLFFNTSFDDKWDSFGMQVVCLVVYRIAHYCMYVFVSHKNRLHTPNAATSDKTVEVSETPSAEADALQMGHDARASKRIVVPPVAVLPMNKRIAVSFRESSYTVAKSKKVILHPMSGVLRPGTMTALMGPSGAGKSTLLRTLVNKSDRSTGVVRGAVELNGSANFDRYKAAMAFVQQEDFLLPTLTVNETIELSAKLRVGGTPAEVAKRVKDTMNALLLDEHAATRAGDERLRGLSGGQQRRLSVGIDLVAEPALVYVVACECSV
jgi:ABC-type lipoprotein export system ATPase subunit